jgi:hypothetical protein
MTEQQRPLEATVEELFTKEELDRARKIFNEYKAKPRYFRGQKLAYCLEHYLRSEREEDGVTRH